MYSHPFQTYSIQFAKQYSKFSVCCSVRVYMWKTQEAGGKRHKSYLFLVDRTELHKINRNRTIKEIQIEKQQDVDEEVMMFYLKFQQIITKYFQLIEMQ